MSVSLFLGFPARDLPHQIRQFPAVDHFVIHHSDQQLLHGPPAEAVDDVTHGLGSDVMGRFDAGIDIGSAFGAMAHIPLLFKPPEYCSRRGFLHEVTLCKGNADVFGRQGAALPEDAHDELFEIAEWFSSAKHCSATNCSDCEIVCQTELQTGGYRLNEG